MHPAEVSSRWMHRQSIIPGQATTSRRASGARGAFYAKYDSAIRRAACSWAPLLFIPSLGRAVARIRPPRGKSYGLSGFRVHRVPADAYNRGNRYPGTNGDAHQGRASHRWYRRLFSLFFPSLANDRSVSRERRQNFSTKLQSRALFEISDTLLLFADSYFWHCQCCFMKFLK